MKLLFPSGMLLLPLTVHAEYLGSLSGNNFDPDSIATPFSTGNPHDPNGLTNPYGPYGNPRSRSSF